MLKGQVFIVLSLITELIVFYWDMNFPSHMKIKSQHRKQSEVVCYMQCGPADFSVNLPAAN